MALNIMNSSNPGGPLRRHRQSAASPSPYLSCPILLAPGTLSRRALLPLAQGVC